MMIDYTGPERRNSVRRLEIDIAEMRQMSLQNTRDNRRLTAQVKAVVDCLDGFRDLAHTLQKREEQKIKLRQVLIEKGITAMVLSAAGGAAAVAWFAVQAWIHGGPR